MGRLPIAIPQPVQPTGVAAAFGRFDTRADDGVAVAADQAPIGMIADGAAAIPADAPPIVAGAQAAPPSLVRPM